jgi:predicted NUDIX family NTP pyrophosphohydrolase
VPKRSAGLVLYRRSAGGELQVLLVHPGGPFWAGKDTGAWSIPKGEHDEGEDPEAAAGREFREELGVEPPPPPWLALGEVVQTGGKRVRAWAVEGDLETSSVVSNTFEMEWPPRSGRHASFPEVDEAAWATVPAARDKLHAGQVPLLDRLLDALGGN